jgi:O-antigen ligase
MKRDKPGMLGGGTINRLLFVVLLIFLLWLPLPWGSNRPWTEFLLGGIAGLLCTCYLLAQIFMRGAGAFVPGQYTWPLLLWVMWLVWVALQLVPLDFQHLQAFSPAAAKLYAQAFPTNHAQTLWPISVFPNLTYHRWLLSLGYFSLYIVTLGLARDRARLHTLGNVLVISALLQAAYGGIMVLSGIEYGFFEHKTAYLGLATGTFVNRNHLAGYLELGAAIAIGLILADLRAVDLGNWKKRARYFLKFLFSTRLRIRVMLAVIVIGLVLTRSRGGNLAFFGALVGTLPIYIFLKERRLFLKSLILFISLLAVDVWIVSGWFGLDKVVSRVEQTHEVTEDRTYAFAAYPGLIEKYQLTGSGMGTFATVFAHNQPDNSWGYFDHAHNDYAEFLIEAGIPGTLILLILGGITALHALRVILRRNDRLRVGICFAFLMGSAELAVHSFTDFNLQMPANAATYVVLMAMAAACPQQGRRRPSSKTVSSGDDSAILKSGNTQQGGDVPDPYLSARKV